MAANRLTERLSHEIRNMILAGEFAPDAHLSTQKLADRFTKRRLYQEQRIPLYWVVDCDAESVEVWTPEALFPVVEDGREAFLVEMTKEQLEKAPEFVATAEGWKQASEPAYVVSVYEYYSLPPPTIK